MISTHSTGTRNIPARRHNNSNAATTGRTPYHELGAGSPRIPSWARHRSVYRAAGRTLYLVQTDSLATACSDLATLSNCGWEVRIDPASGGGAHIALTRRTPAKY